VKSKAAVSVLAVITVCALSATSGQAGSGAGIAPFDTFFVCQNIDGANVGEVVSITDLDGAAIPGMDKVRVGSGVLLCTNVKVKNSAGGDISGGVLSTELKCYSISVKGPKAASQQFSLVDDFRLETVNVSPSPQLLCGPTIPNFVGP
jgi:hypothetical protein